MEKMHGVTCNQKGLPKGPLTNIEDGLEQSVSDQAKERISGLLERIESLSDVEKLLLYLKLPTGSATEDVLRQTPTSFLYASNRLEQAQAFTWIRSHLEEDSQICVPKHEVYDDYRSYCESHGLKALCPADFGKVLKCIFPNVKPRRLGQRGQSRYCYSGLRKKLDIQPPSLPELEISPKKPKTEELQENELFSASCQLVCEWAGKLLQRGFTSLRELSEFLVGNLYVNSKSTAAFTVLAAMQEAGLHNSRVPVSPLFTCSSGGDKHRETQLQLQRKLQERELFKEQKKRLQQQRSEIEQEQLQHSRGPSATPTKSPLPHSFSKTPTPIKSPSLRPPSSLNLKSPGPGVVTFRQTPTPTNLLHTPARNASRNITKLLQSPVQGDRTVSSQYVKTESADVSVATATPVAAALISAATTTSLPPSSSAIPAVSVAAAATRIAEGSGIKVHGPPGVKDNGGGVNPPAMMLSSVNGMNLLTRGGHQFIISGSQGLILDSGGAGGGGEAFFKNGMHVVQKPMVVSAGASNPQLQAVSTAQLQTVTVGGSSIGVGGLGGSLTNLSGSVGNISNSGSSTSSFDSVHMGQGITIVTKPRETSAAGGGGGEKSAAAVDADSVASVSDVERCRTDGGVNFIPGNLSTRSAFVPVSNQKLAFTLIAPNLGAAVPMSESSSDESKDQDDLPVPMDQSEHLSSSGGFEVPLPEGKAESASMQFSSDSSSSQTSLNLVTSSPQHSGGGHQKKAKNRFTPIRPKAPPGPVACMQKEKTPEKDPRPATVSVQKEKLSEDSRPVSALLREKRDKRKAREAREVLQHLASSFQSQAGSKAFPSTLTVPSEMLGLSPDKAPSGGGDVVIILTSPSAGSGKVVAADLAAAEEKRDKPGSLALSMSDVLVANPSFVQKEAVAAAATAARVLSKPHAEPPAVSATNQPIARQILNENLLASTRSSGDVAVSSAGSVCVGKVEGVCDAWDPGSAADEEVTQHMTSATSLAGRLLSSEGRGGADTPSSRKRKSSGQGHASQTQHKRINFTTVDRRMDREDDDVFIVDAPPPPCQSPLPPPEVPSSFGGKRMLMSGGRLTDVTGRSVGRLDVVSPYHRPGSSTFVSMQVEEPVSVSRCQSTGVGLALGGDEAAYAAHLAIELSRQTRGKLNVESLESDALLDTGQLVPPIPPLAARQPSRSSAHLARSLGQKACVGTSVKDLAAAQQALLLEKELLDARLNMYLNKAGWGQDDDDDMATILEAAGFPVDSVDDPALKGGVSDLPETVTAMVAPPVVTDGGYSPGQFTAHSNSTQGQQQQQQQSHLSTQPDHMFPPGLTSAPSRSNPLIAQTVTDSSSQAGQILSDQRLLASSHAGPGCSQDSLFPEHAGMMGKAQLSPLEFEGGGGLGGSQLSDAGMGVDSFQVDSISNFFDLVEGMDMVPNPSPGHNAASAPTATATVTTGTVSESFQPSTLCEQGHASSSQTGTSAIHLSSSSTSSSASLAPSATPAKVSFSSSSGTLAGQHQHEKAAAAGNSTLSVAGSSPKVKARGMPSQGQVKGSQVKAKSGGSQQPPPNTLLALLQSPVLSALSPSTLVTSSQSIKKTIADKLALSSSSSVSQEPTRRSQNQQQQQQHRGARSSLMAASSLSPQQASPVGVGVEKAISSTSTRSTSLSDELSQSNLGGKTPAGRTRSAASVDSKLLAASTMTSASTMPEVEREKATVAPTTLNAMLLGAKARQAQTQGYRAGTQVPASSPAKFGSFVRQSDGGGALRPDSTTTLEPVPANLPSNFLDAGEQGGGELGGELPLDVANFVTDYSVGVPGVGVDQPVQPQQQPQARSRPSPALHLQTDTLRLDKELQNFLLHSKGVSTRLQGSEGAGAPETMETGMRLSSDNLGPEPSKETFPMPSNPAPKQRLSESGPSGAKKYPPVQRSASLPGFARGTAPANPSHQELSPVPSHSPTREPRDATPVNSGGGVPAPSGRRVRPSSERVSSASQAVSTVPMEAAYPAYELSPNPPPPPSSTPTQDMLAAGMASLRRNPMLSARPDSAQSVSSEGVLSLPQGSPLAPLSNPGSVSAACSPEDGSVTSPSAFMPIPVSSSPSSLSSSSSAATVRVSGQQSYVHPIKPMVTMASFAVGDQEAHAIRAALVAGTTGGLGSARTLGLLSAAGNTLDLSQLSQLGVGVVVSSEGPPPQTVSPMEMSPAGSVQSVKSEVGSGAAQRLMSTSPCPGTVPYNALSPRHHPGGVSPGPSPTPATSNVCSPAPVPAQRVSNTHGVLQKLLSTRTAPPSYAESVQQRLMASNQVIGGFVDHRQSLAAQPNPAGAQFSGSVRARAGSAQSRNSSGGGNAIGGSGTVSTNSAELSTTSGPFSAPLSSADDGGKASAKSVVHHIPSSSSSSTSTSTAGATLTSSLSGSSSGGERSGRRIAILKRDSNTKPRSSSSSTSSSSTMTQKVSAAASDSLLKASLASPPSPADSGGSAGLDYSRHFSQKLMLLKQQMSQSELEGLERGAGRRQAASTASAVLAASLASLKQGGAGGAQQGEPSSPSIKLIPSPGVAGVTGVPTPGGKTGGVAPNLAVQVSSPATPGSVSSASSPASQGQGQGPMSVPLRISTSTPSHSSDIFFGLPASSPSPRVNPFSPQQQSQSSSSSTSSTSNPPSTTSAQTSSVSALYMPFNLPDMNYMGNAPNIDLSQLMPGKPATPTAAVQGQGQGGSSQSAADSGGNELQGLDELHMTLDILRGMDGQYFSGQELEGEELMGNVFSELTQELQASAPPSSSALSQDEDELGDGEEGVAMAASSSGVSVRSKVQEST